MTLPASFPLSMSQVATELGLSLPLSINHAWVEALAGQTGLPVSFSELLGKTGNFSGSLTLTNNEGFAYTAMNSPFFGTTLTGLSTEAGGGILLVAAATPNYTGNVILTNTSLGKSAVLTWNQSQLRWTGSNASGGVTEGTYNFTIYPHT